ncbi:hypothetical protein F4X90_22710 [Candidatus Poribacteria bacterium]|nr:hypothetical protein [Candidatus Poribacteria bacterium]
MKPNALCVKCYKQDGRFLLGFAIFLIDKTVLGGKSDGVSASFFSVPLNLTETPKQKHLRGYDASFLKLTPMLIHYKSP